jgi:hypothetical protein
MSEKVGDVVASAGIALGELAHGEETAWELDLDVPQSTVDDDSQWPWQVIGGVLAFLAGAVALVMLFVLKALVESENHHQQAVTIALAVGVVLAMLLVALVAWRALAYPGARVRLKLRKTAPAQGVGAAAALADFVAALAEPGAAAPAGAAPVAVPAAAALADAAKGGASTTAESPPKSLVAKEPVIIGTGLVAAGTLAVGLAANLGSEEVAAIAAGASALVGVLLRQQVTPLADPKDAQKKPLTS